MDTFSTSLTGSFRQRAVRLLILLAALAGPAVLGVRTAYAGTTIKVTTPSDVVDGTDGKCSLREAIDSANNNHASGVVGGECPAGTTKSSDTITLAGGKTYDLNSTLPGSLIINNNSPEIDLVIKARGDGKPTIKQLISSSPVFIINPTASVQMKDLIIEGGESLNNPASGLDGGGGIVNQGTLKLTSCTLRNNQSDSNGGAIYNAGTLTLQKTTIRNNTASEAGGGIYNGDNATLTMIGSTIRDNSSHSGGGLSNADTASATLTNSTVADNSATNGDGGGLLNNGDMTITGTTISGNSSPVSSLPLFNGGGVANYGSMLIEAGSYVVFNTASEGGGIYNQSTLTIDNSAVAGNQADLFGGGIKTYNGVLIIQNRSVIGSNTASVGGGISIESSSVSIQDSTLYNNSASADAGAVYAYQGTTLTINSSCVVGNDDNALLNYPGLSGQLDVTGNWWGSADGPSGDGPGSGDSVSGDFDWSGWLTAVDGSACDLVLNGAMEDDADANDVPDEWTANSNVSLPSDGRFCANSDCYFLMNGIGTNKTLSQSIVFAGTTSDNFTITASSETPTSVPTGGTYDVLVRFFHTDGTFEDHPRVFSTGLHGWETESLTFPPFQNYAGVKVLLRFNEASGSAQFDNVTFRINP